MKYIGRLSLLGVVAVFTLIQIFIFKDPLREQLFDTLISSIIAWFVGKQYDKMRFHAERDFLTGIYNRRFATKVFPKLKHTANKNKQPLGIFIIDINYFKQINDKYGHGAGDEALKLLSNAINQNIRKSDIAVRWGGDEFMILAPAITTELTNKLSSQIHHDFIMLVDKTWNLDNDLGISVGLAIYPSDGKNIEDLAKVADKKMYEIKLHS